MDSLLQSIPGVVSYIDDILITGTTDEDTDEEHLHTLDRVLEQLETAGLRLNTDKCVFLAETVVFLGHKIDQHGLHLTEEKVRAVQAAPKPHNVAELKAFLGLLTYYGKFIPNLSTTLAPLYRLLRTCTRRWTNNEQEAFQAAKNLLSSQVLAHYNTQDLILACDASPYGVGAVLSLRYPDGSERPIGYASRTLSAVENYSQLEKEALGGIFGVKHFHSYVCGRTFTLATDQKPLLSLFSEKKPVQAQPSGCLQQWALTLAMYEYILVHKTSTHCRCTQSSAYS